MSRRDQIRMSEAELRGFIDGSQTIILNSIGKDGVPHPMPMWFGREEDGAIVMSTFTKSQKIRNLERDPRVSLLVESGTAYSELRGVVLYGSAELVRDVDAVVEILVRVNRRSIPAGDGGPDDDAIRSAVRGTAPKRTGIRVRPERIVSWDHSKLAGVY
jgi:PPOX class probable F420-dependent enzyme